MDEQTQAKRRRRVNPLSQIGRLQSKKDNLLLSLSLIETEINRYIDMLELEYGQHVENGSTYLVKHNGKIIKLYRDWDGILMMQQEDGSARGHEMRADESINNEPADQYDGSESEPGMPF